MINKFNRIWFGCHRQKAATAHQRTPYLLRTTNLERSTFHSKLFGCSVPHFRKYSSHLSSNCVEIVFKNYFVFVTCSISIQKKSLINFVKWITIDFSLCVAKWYTHTLTPKPNAHIRIRITFSLCCVRWRRVFDAFYLSVYCHCCRMIQK